MDATRIGIGAHRLSGGRRGTVLLALVCCLTSAHGRSQNPPVNPDGTAVGDQADAPAATLSMTSTSEDRSHEAWRILMDAAGDTKHTQTRIQALAALGMLRTPQSEKMIADAMGDPDVDVRTAAALAAGQTKDRNLTTGLRNLLDDKEPQVEFTAATTLWKMGDRSGEDILMSVVDGGRSAVPTIMHGAGHSISRDLHDPAKLARLGATQGAAMLLGPFGFGIAAFEYVHSSGGNLARVSAIEQVSQQKTEPIHKELMAALGDKDPAVRAASAKALVEYQDNATSMAVYALFIDPKYPVRLTCAAAYLRTTGVPGPSSMNGTADAETPQDKPAHPARPVTTKRLANPK